MKASFLILSLLLASQSAMSAPTAKTKAQAKKNAAAKKAAEQMQKMAAIAKAAAEAPIENKSCALYVTGSTNLASDIRLWDELQKKGYQVRHYADEVKPFDGKKINSKSKKQKMLNEYTVKTCDDLNGKLALSFEQGWLDQETVFTKAAVKRFHHADCSKIKPGESMDLDETLRESSAEYKKPIVAAHENAEEAMQARHSESIFNSIASLPPCKEVEEQPKPVVQNPEDKNALFHPSCKIFVSDAKNEMAEALHNRLKEKGYQVTQFTKEVKGFKGGVFDSSKQKIEKAQKHAVKNCEKMNGNLVLKFESGWRTSSLGYTKATIGQYEHLGCDLTFKEEIIKDRVLREKEILYIKPGNEQDSDVEKQAATLAAHQDSVMKSVEALPQCKVSDVAVNLDLVNSNALSLTLDAPAPAQNQDGREAVKEANEKMLRQIQDQQQKARAK